MHRLALVLVLALSSLAGCYQTEHVQAPPAAPKVVVLGCGPELTEACTAAATVWAPSGAPVTVGDVATFEVVFTHGNPRPCGEEPLWYGCTRREEHLIEVDETVLVGVVNPKELLIDILVHEVGHALGLGHLDSGIMYTRGPWFTCVDIETAAHLRGVEATCPL